MGCLHQGSTMAIGLANKAKARHVLPCLLRVVTAPAYLQSTQPTDVYTRPGLPSLAIPMPVVKRPCTPPPAPCRRLAISSTARQHTATLATRSPPPAGPLPPRTFPPYRLPAAFLPPPGAVPPPPPLPAPPAAPLCCTPPTSSCRQYASSISRSRCFCRSTSSICERQGGAGAVRQRRGSPQGPQTRVARWHEGLLPVTHIREH